MAARRQVRAVYARVLTATNSLEPDALVDLIMARYYAIHRAELPDLINLAQRAEALHPNHSTVPRGWGALLIRMRSNLEAHMQKEEDGLFPAMLAAQPISAEAIEIMRDEHDDHEVHISELRRSTGDHTAPPDASADWRLLCERTRKFAEALAEHIRLENDVLFSCFSGEAWEITHGLRRPSTRLRFDIDLPPPAVETERLHAELTYPEWDAALV